MKFDGRILAEALYQKLKENVEKLFASTQIRPRVSVFLIGDNPSSLSFIKQKRIAAEKIGAILDLHQSLDISYEDFKEIIQKSNLDPDIHGIVIQRPLPDSRRDLTALLQSIIPKRISTDFYTILHSKFQ